MPSTQQNRGAVAAFLDAKASWIKGNLGRKQRDIAADLYNELKDERPSCSVDSINVALTRWLQKHGLSGRSLQARLAAGTESELDSKPLSAITEMSGAEPHGECLPAGSGTAQALEMSPSPSVAPDVEIVAKRAAIQPSRASQSSPLTEAIAASGERSPPTKAKVVPPSFFKRA